MEKNKKQGQHNQGKKEGQPGQKGDKKHDRKHEPKASGKHDQPSGRSGQQVPEREPSQHREQQSRGSDQSQNREGKVTEPSGREIQGQSRGPITNQDQQHQATNVGNTGDTVMGEAETEGDRRQHERIKPYKNMGDDSKDIEKKKPTME